MSPWTRRSGHVVIVLPRGTDVLEGIADAANEAGVTSGSLVGIGAIEGPRLAWFDRYNKAYRERTFDGVWEIVNLTGTVSQYENDLRIHCHVTASGRDCHVRGGHLAGGKVAVTCELVLVPYEDPLVRRLNGEFDLPLLDL
ncbi:MAG TPA: PPC domain-containing DNA-binding protein [Gemmatimonadota bacterium]|nr:PPC domain-containing DNA-binding protein [Gemmatimonadota bacterium]